VGCDIATEAHRLGANKITMIDVQKPAAFGKEREDAEAIGATFQWPCFTKKITAKGVELQNGKFLPAETVVISIGDIPDLDFLDSKIEVNNGFISVNKYNQTSQKNVFAIGDVAGPGLITDAIGAGKKAALAIDGIIQGKENFDLSDLIQILPQIDKQRVSLEYYNPLNIADNMADCGANCASCGQCRDCGICVAICPEGAIERVETDNKGFEYISNPELCIGCGFCKGACPCGIWDLIPNTPM
jgi:ferredoxin